MSRLTEILQQSNTGDMIKINNKFFPVQQYVNYTIDAIMESEYPGSNPTIDNLSGI